MISVIVPRDVSAFRARGMQCEGKMRHVSLSDTHMWGLDPANCVHVAKTDSPSDSMGWQKVRAPLMIRDNGIFHNNINIIMILLSAPLFQTMSVACRP